MPPEWAAHERTLMAWPCRASLWGPRMAAAKEEYAGVANAIAAFEPVTMVCGSASDAAEARAALAGEVDVVELPIDDSWLRDNGPVFLLDDEGRRLGVHFGFNAWGEDHPPWDRDAAVGGLLVEMLGDEVVEAPLILEGGSVVVDGRGRVLTTEQCLLNPNRNPSLSREEIEGLVLGHLGQERMVWLGRGLALDKDTDGHVDLICAPLGPGRVLMHSAPEGSPDAEPMADNAARAASAGIEVTPFPPLATVVADDGLVLAASYLNLYLCNGAAIVPVFGDAQDEEALARLRTAFGPQREVVPVPAATIALGGGGPHCITQQVPVAGVRAD
jgi:agmatine deiminase